jgi:hypothetical protein
MLWMHNKYWNLLKVDLNFYKAVINLKNFN